MVNRIQKQTSTISLILLLCIFSNGCATSAGMTAAAVTSATISVGAAVVKTPFKLAGMVGGDEDDESSDND